MLTAVQLRRRKLFGALAAIVGVVLIGFGIAGLTGNLGSGSTKASETPAITAPSSAASGAATDSNSTASGSAASESSASDSAAASSSTEVVKLPVTVLNAGGASGLAGRIRDALKTKGWTTAEIGNFTGSKPAQSTIYYPANNPDAQASAEALKSDFPKLTQVEQAPSSLKYTGIVLVVTGDWDPKDG